MTTIQKTIAIKTARGEISAMAVNDDAYPCIRVMINGKLATVVELDSDNDIFRIYTHQGDKNGHIASYEYNTASIFDYKIVQEEIQRIRELEDDGRDIEGDISILKQGLSEIYEIVVGQTEQAIISNTNMWDECHTSLDKILKFFNLIVVDDSTYFDDYKFLVVKK
ncbi:hypothetical protein CN410_14965 [Bacillus anthracis]|nr:hypothetical protein CN410_14965 [Bacillus anthracis]